MVYRFLAILLMVWGISAVAADNELDELTVRLGDEWQPVKNDQFREIKTWAKLEDGKRYRSFKVEFYINSSMATLGRVLFDFGNYPRWFWGVMDAKLLKTVSDTENYCYMTYNAPLGIPDRDTIIHTTIEPITNHRNSAVLRIHALPSYLPIQPPYVRMVSEEIQLRITPVAPEKIRIELEGYIDPGGTVPAWATNFVQRSAPYSTAAGLQRQVKLAQYRDSNETPAFSLVKD